MFEKMILLYSIAVSLYLAREIYLIRRNRKPPAATEDKTEKPVYDVVGKPKKTERCFREPENTIIDEKDIYIGYEKIPEENEIIGLEYENDSEQDWVSPGVTLNELEHTFDVLGNGISGTQNITEAAETLVKMEDTDMLDLIIQFASPNEAIKSAIDSVFMEKDIKPPFNTRRLTRKEIEEFDLNRIFY